MNAGIWALVVGVVFAPVAISLCTLLALCAAPADLNDAFDDGEEDLW